MGWRHYFGVKVALLHSVAQWPAVMSAQLVPFRQFAQLSSGLPQLASQEKPDELRLHD